MDAALTAASGDLLTSSLQSKDVQTTDATVLFAGTGPVMFGASAGSSADSAAAAADASSSSDTSSLSGAEYFGIAIAVILGVCAIAGGTLFVVRRRRRQSRYTTFEGDGLNLTTTTGMGAAPQRAHSDDNQPARMQF